MTQFKLENHNAVTLLNRLRIATHSTTAHKRRSIYNGLSDALKGLGLIETKEKIEGIYEGVDKGGNHWFMVDMGDRLPPAGANPDNLFSKEIQVLVGQLHHAIGTVTGAVPPLEIEAVIRAATDVLLNAKASILPSRLTEPGDRPDNRFATDSKLLGDLLAVLHGDGGQYQSEHGVEKAVKDAIEKWNTVVLTQHDYEELLSIARSLGLQGDGQDNYFNSLAERLTVVTARFYHGQK